MGPIGLIYLLMLLGFFQPPPLSYLIAARRPVAITTRDAPNASSDAVVQSVVSSSEGKQLAFWCESLHGPIASCFAQAFASPDSPRSGVVPVFDLPPTTDAVAGAGDGRFVSEWGTALWTGDDQALLLIGYLRPNKGNRLLVQHWAAGATSEPQTITTDFDLSSWATLVRDPAGRVFAVWLARDRYSSFTICAKHLDAAGTPDGETMRLQPVNEVAAPGVVAVAATEGGLTVVWKDSIRYQPVIYARQFDGSGNPLGEPAILFEGRAAGHPAIAAAGAGRIVVAATTPDGDVLIHTIGRAPVQAAAGAEPSSVRVAVAENGAIGIAWRDRNHSVWFQRRSPSLDPIGPPRLIADGVTGGFLSLEARGTAWQFHFRKRPADASMPYLWLASAAVPDRR
jgi:hypothetical protein